MATRRAAVRARAGAGGSATVAGPNKPARQIPDMMNLVPITKSSPHGRFAAAFRFYRRASTPCSATTSLLLLFPPDINHAARSRDPHEGPTAIQRAFSNGCDTSDLHRDIRKIRNNPPRTAVARVPGPKRDLQVGRNPNRNVTGAGAQEGFRHRLRLKTRDDAAHRGGSFQTPANAGQMDGAIRAFTAS